MDVQLSEAISRTEVSKPLQCELILWCIPDHICMEFEHKILKTVQFLPFRRIKLLTQHVDKQVF